MAPTVVVDEPETAAPVETRGTMKRRGLIAGAAALAAGILAAKAQPADAATGTTVTMGILTGSTQSTFLYDDRLPNGTGVLNYPYFFVFSDAFAYDNSFPAAVLGYATGAPYTAAGVSGNLTSGIYGFTNQAAGYGTVGLNSASNAAAVAVRGYASQGFGAFFTTSGSTLNNGTAGHGAQGKGPVGVSGYGTSAPTPIGLFGSGDGTVTGTVGIGVNAYGANGVSGQANSANGIGVVGTATGTGGGGVTGVASGQGATGTKGQSVNTNGIGAEGIGGGTNSVGVQGMIPQGTTAAGTMGMYGVNYSTAQNSHGIIGLANSAGHGLIGTSNSVSPQNVGGTTYYYAGLVGLGNNGSNAGNFYGNVSITGTLNGHSAVMQAMQIAVAHPDGSHRLAHGITATEAWLEDFGKGTITGNQAEVKIDAEFMAIAELSNYYVFLTSHGDVNLHVAATKPDSFTVQVTGGSAGVAPGSGAIRPGQGAGASGVSFDWRIVAKPKGASASRLAKYTIPNIVPPQIPTPHDTSSQVILKTTPQPALPDNAPTLNPVTP